MRLRLLSASSLLLCAGCHQSVSAHSHGADRRMQQDYAAALTVDASQTSLAPSDLTALHQQRGVGVGLQIDGRRFRAGQNIPLLVVYEDIAAPGPLSSTSCDGFSITIEDVTRGTETLAPISACQTDEELTQNNVALVEGNVRFLHTSLFGARQELTQPGKYLIRAAWQSHRPRNGGFRNEDAYATVRSNVIPIVVTP